MADDDAMYHPKTTNPCMSCELPTNRIDLNFEGWLHRDCIPDMLEKMWDESSEATE